MMPSRIAQFLGGQASVARNRVPAVREPPYGNVRGCARGLREREAASVAPASPRSETHGPGAPTRFTAHEKRSQLNRGLPLQAVCVPLSIFCLQPFHDAMCLIEVCNDSALETLSSGIVFFHGNVPMRRVNQFQRLAIAFASQ